MVVKTSATMFSKDAISWASYEPTGFLWAFLVFSLSQYCLHLTGSMFCLPNNLELIIVMSSQSKSKDCIQFMQAAISRGGLNVIKSKWFWEEVFVQFVEVRGRNCGGSSFQILHNCGITDQRRYLNMNPIRVHMELWVPLLMPILLLSWLLLCHGLDFGRNYFQILCTGGMVVQW